MLLVDRAGANISQCFSFCIFHAAAAAAACFNWAKKWRTSYFYRLVYLTEYFAEISRFGTVLLLHVTRRFGQQTHSATAFGAKGSDPE